MAGQDVGQSLGQVILVVLAAVLLFPLLMMVSMMPMMGIMGGAGQGATAMSPIWGIGMMLLALAVFLGLGYFLYRIVTRSALTTSDPALEELRLAYARGELSQEEFEQRRKDLERTE